jgi:hypothetical protein
LTLGSGRGGVNGLADAAYDWHDDADPRDATFLAHGETRAEGGAPVRQEETLRAVYPVFDDAARHLGEVDVALSEMPDADEQPVGRHYRVTGVDDEGRITGLEWGPAVDAAWRQAREE